MLLLSHLLVNASNTLTDFFMGEISAERLGDAFFDYASMYIVSLKKVNIEDIVARLRAYEYDFCSAGVLESKKIEEVEEHCGLSKWYFEFCLKLYLASEVEGMAPRLQQVQKALRSGPVLTLGELAGYFNVVLDGSKIDGVERFRMEAPNREVADYYFKAIEKYSPCGMRSTG